MSNFLLIPVQVDALVLANDHSVAGSMADFSQLPYTNGSQDIHTETPNLSEECIAPPFQDQALYLRKGIHLHWSLPDALTNAQQTTQNSQFPAVPNRWIVVRSKNNTVEKQWLVESDYLYPENMDTVVSSITIPYTPDRTKGQSCPYRYLGRTIPLPLTTNQLPIDDPTSEFLNPLTAVGYGEPTFAAFYPNCYSVFGLCDEDYTGAALLNLHYDLFGWYSDPTQDFMQIFLTTFLSSYQQQYGKSPDQATILSALEDRAKWTFSQESNQPFPNALLCYGRLTFTLDQAPDLSTQGSDLTIAVGATGTEALSAYLAQTIDSSRAAMIEDQLESLYIMPQLEKGQLDIGPAFSAARHTRGFTASTGGSLWSIQSVSITNVPQDPSQLQVTLPEDMAHSLNELNLLQQTFDRSTQEITARQGQLFADWYKYMLCVYRPEDARENFPDIDEVLFAVEHLNSIPLEQRIAETGTLELSFDSNGFLIGARAPAQTDTQGALLAQAIMAMLQAIEAFNQANTAQGVTTTYMLKQIPAPRYWQPNEPAILVVGKDVEATTRHGQDGRLRADGLLEGQILPSSTTINDLVSSQFGSLRTLVDTISKDGAAEHIGINTWTQQPWNPIVLEWEVEVFPLKNQGNLDPTRAGYTPDFITGNALLRNGEAYFQSLRDQVSDPATTSPLAVEQVDLSLQDGQGAVVRGANVYDGLSILAPHASSLLQDQLEGYLQQNLLPLYYAAQNIPLAQQSDSYLNDHSADILKWYQTTSGWNDASDPLAILTKAYSQLIDESFHSLSQSLGGFNNALLMRKQTFQLPLADPLGFDDYQAFTARVSDLVQNNNKTAPEPLNDFNPIRCGTLRLQRLSLLDTFGQSKDLDNATVITTQQMTTDGNPYLVTLPLRLTQPSRLNFRWLSAVSGEQEMNDHPASSPICGWLLPNDLDVSLMIYDSNGSALGQIDQQVVWLPAPGSQQSTTPENIANPALKELVQYILSKDTDFFGRFFSTIGNALESIAPETFAQHSDLAILMGRPVALVRASLNLELQGLPAIHQGWEIFLQEMQQFTRDNNDFTSVQFPLRIGEYELLNDGVLGFWQETTDQSLTGQPFHSAYADSGNTSITDSMTLLQTLEDQPITLSMLLDPRGTVHLTSGVVPLKEISIPPDQFTSALQAIEITFLTAPILTAQGTTQLPLPSEAGFTWTWLQKEPATWSRIPVVPVIQQQSFQATLGTILWNTLLTPTISWLTTTTENPQTGNVVESDLRGSSTLGESFTGLQSIVEKILANITTITQADFVQQVGILIATPLWQTLLTTTVAWLQTTATDPNWALVIAKSARASATLQGAFAGMEPVIGQIFDLSQQQITAVNLNATFVGQQELRDGWLLLSST